MIVMSLQRAQTPLLDHMNVYVIQDTLVMESLTVKVCILYWSNLQLYKLIQFKSNSHLLASISQCFSNQSQKESN